MLAERGYSYDPKEKVTAAQVSYPRCALLRMPGEREKGLARGQTVD